MSEDNMFQLRWLDALSGFAVVHHAEPGGARGRAELLL